MIVIQDWLLNDLLFIAILLVMVDAVYGIFIKYRMVKYAKVLICDKDGKACRELFGNEEYVFRENES